MKKELKDYFYNHYEDNGPPYPDMTSYSSVKEFFRNQKDENVQSMIYNLGLHVLAKSIVNESMERLDDGKECNYISAGSSHYIQP